MPGPRPVARLRAERELIADPARSNAIIAVAARTASQYVGRARQQLERAGVIETIPVTDRLARPRIWAPRAPRKAVEAGAATVAEIRQLAPGVSYGAAWRALDRARRRLQLDPVPVRSDPRDLQPADAAAAADSLRVRRTRVPAPKPGVQLAERPPPGFYAAPDPIQWPCCTAEWADGGWVHERSCVARRSR